jgi:RHS repeat-associated protein
LQEDYATYTYSANGNKTSVTDARGYKASMTYDGVDRQSAWNFPSPTTPGTVSSTDYEQYGFDASGNRTSFRKRDGSTLTYQYDALNRITVKIVPERAGLDPTHTRDVYYGYDSFGRMTFARFDSTSGVGVSTGYNGFSEITSSTNTMPGAETSFTYLFDADGNRTRVTFGDGNYVTYEFDGLDRPIGIYRLGGITQANYSYNTRGARATFGGGFSTSYAYQPDGKLSTLTNTPIASGYSAQYGFSYNPASQITQTTRDNDAFAWNGATNANESYAANGLNQYTSAIGSSYAYDANGNLTSDGSTTYVYDVENRLVSASGAKNAALIYDPMGRLYAYGTTTSTTRFAYDGDALMLEWDAYGNLLRRYVHGTDAGDDPIIWYEGSGFTDVQQRLLRPDYQDSIVAVSNGSGTGIVAINSFDEYGLPGTANQGRFQYTGQAWMPELGLYYYKARMYSPKLGRFMQTDPIGYIDDLNLYAFVGNDPIGRIDPTGQAELILQNTGNSEDAAAQYARSWDTPDFDIATHGNPDDGAIMDTRRYTGLPIVGAKIYPYRVYQLMREKGYRDGTNVRLSGCGISPETAADLSAASSATVYFTSHFAITRIGKDGKPAKIPNEKHDGSGADLQWQSITVNGSHVSYTNEYGGHSNYTYNSGTGRLTEATAATGSIIRKSVCADSKKCGK